MLEEACLIVRGVVYGIVCKYFVYMHFFKQIKNGNHEFGSCGQCYSQTSTEKAFLMKGATHNKDYF